MAQTIWKGRLLFGLLSIPIKLRPAARRDRLPFRNVYSIAPPTAAAGNGAPSNVVSFPSSSPPAEPPLPDHVAPVRMAYVGGDPAVILDPSAIFKGYAVGGSFAVFRNSELAALRARSTSGLLVKHFVDPSEIPQKYYEKSYDVWPDYGGEKGYELFCLGLRDRTLAAIGELALYGRERTVAIRQDGRGLVLYTLYCDGEVNFDDEYELKPGLASERELELTRALMMEQRRPFDPSILRDKYQERVLEFILTRCQSVFPMVADGASTSGEPAEPPRRAPVLSLEEALTRSLDMVRKPVKSEGDGKPPRKKEGKRRAK